MKTQMETFESLIAEKIKIINGLVTGNGGRGLINVLLKYVRPVRPKATKSVVKQVVIFCFRSHKIAAASGLKGLVIYLKACQVMLQQSIGHYRVADLSELKVRPKRTRSGVPLMIPAGARRSIFRDRDIPTIRLWMTLFGLYRVLEYYGSLNLETITRPGVDLRLFLPQWESWLYRHFLPQLKKMVTLPDLPKPSLFPILKSSPTTGVSGLDKFLPDDFTSYVNTSLFSLVRGARIILSVEWLAVSMEFMARALKF